VGFWATWSPDGKQIAFAKETNLLIADADGLHPQPLTALPGRASFVRFSPDGTRLRFTLTDPRDSNSTSLWEVRSDGKDAHSLLPGWRTPPRECCGEWTPDGRYYFFVSGDPNHWEICALAEARGPFHKRSAPVQLTTGPMLFTWGVPSPDGNKFYVDGYMPRSELVRYDSKAQGFLPFLSGISADYVDFSRNGQWVVYVSQPDQTLWRGRVDGSERLQLTFPPVVPWLPHWSPDGSQIAYADTQRKPWKSFVVSAEGGAPVELYPEKNAQVDAHWSPDGKQIMFGRTPFLPGTSDTIDIQILDLESRRTSTLAGSENLYSPRWSPDGQHVAAVSADNKKLVVYDFKAKKWSDWITGIGFIGTPIWSRDGKYVYLDHIIGDHQGYIRIKVGETRSEFLVDLKDLHRSWWSGITPDNTPIFSRDISTDEIYALDVELP
jgi:Tol biopolymer transport system component